MAKALSAEQHELLSFLEQGYLTHGHIPSRDVVVSNGVCDEAFYNKCLRSADFRHALIARGINVRGLDPDTAGGVGKRDNGILTEEQLVCANTMLDLLDNRSQKKKLNDLGVSTTKWNGWLRDPAFQSYLRTRAEDLLGDSLHDAHLALVDRVRSGDVSAIKYFNEITGRYNPGLNDKADVNAILMGVMEVLQKHLSDQPELLMSVGEDLLALAPTKVIAKPMRPIVAMKAIDQAIEGEIVM